MPHSLVFTLKDGTVHAELVPDSYLYVARAIDTGEVVASIDSDDALLIDDKSTIAGLCEVVGLDESDHRVIWFARTLH
jgi:hypothetical protein